MESVKAVSSFWDLSRTSGRPCPTQSSRYFSRSSLKQLMAHARRHEVVGGFASCRWPFKERQPVRKSNCRHPRYKAWQLPASSEETLWQQLTLLPGHPKRIHWPGLPHQLHQIAGRPGIRGNIIFSLFLGTMALKRRASQIPSSLHWP